jgi:fido (protein-threonine AMPylation protein)
VTIPWRDDPPGSEARIRRNLEALRAELARSATAREAPTVELARSWHRAILDGVELPVPYYAGGIRDRDLDEAELVDHEVMWGGKLATPAVDVWPQLREFERAAGEGTETIDAAVSLGEGPSDPATLNSALALAAALHNEWVRIHPHVNGNGRIARCWANWTLLRYGLPAFVRLRPRPESALYARAAALARQRVHGPMQRYFHYLLRGELARDVGTWPER